MFKLILVLLTFSVYVSEEGQLTHPLCGTIGVAGKEIYADDPASCHSYLFCEWNQTDLTHLITVRQLDCRNQNSNHYMPDPNDSTTGRCVDVRAGCEDDNMFFCPDLDIMVANPFDKECRQFRPCRLPDFQWIECRSPLVFNRNTGACDFAERAPCSEHEWHP